MGLRYSFQMYLRFLGVQIRSQMQFRASFWSDLISTGLLNGSIFLSLALILARFGEIGGWKLGEIAFLAGMVEMSFGTMDMIFSGFDPSMFSQFVQLGTFDQMMLRPVGVFWQVLGSRFLIRRFGKIFEGMVIFAISLTLLQVHWSGVKLAYLLVVFASQVLMMGSLFVIGSTITFWTVESSEATNILTYGGNELMSYPAHIYPAWLRSFFTFLVPLIFINFYPALYFLDKPDPLHLPAFMPFLAPLVAGVFFWLGLLIWQFGVNHYQSTGS